MTGTTTLTNLKEACVDLRTVVDAANISLEVVLQYLDTTRATFLNWQSGASGPRAGGGLIAKQILKHASDLDLMVANGEIGKFTSNYRITRKRNNEIYRAKFL
jgi:hypothetical protein